MKNPLLEQWELKMQEVFDRVDEQLEKRYKGKFSLKPNRPEAGEGISPNTDGLFDISILFTPGFGSELGAGYVFKVRLATAERVPQEFIKSVEDEASELVKLELSKLFPGKQFDISRDGRSYKITGDLDLN